MILKNYLCFDILVKRKSKNSRVTETAGNLQHYVHTYTYVSCGSIKPSDSIESRVRVYFLQ